MAAGTFSHQRNSMFRTSRLYKVKFYRIFEWFRDFGRQQQLKEYVSDGIVAH